MGFCGRQIVTKCLERQFKMLWIFLKTFKDLQNACILLLIKATCKSAYLQDSTVVSIMWEGPLLENSLTHTPLRWVTLMRLTVLVCLGTANKSRDQNTYRMHLMCAAHCLSVGNEEAQRATVAAQIETLQPLRSAWRRGEPSLWWLFTQPHSEWTLPLFIPCQYRKTGRAHTHSEKQKPHLIQVPSINLFSPTHPVQGCSSCPGPAASLNTW